MTAIRAAGRRCAVLAAFALSGCGYFESAFNPVEPSQTVLSGRVVDRVSRKPIIGAAVKLKGEKEVSVVTLEGGVFQFPDASTGEKSISVEMAGYRPFSRPVDLSLDFESLDTLYLDRVNRPPKILKVDYPGPGATDIPFSVNFEMTLTDPDQSSLFSSESLHYRLYLGTAYPLPLSEAGGIPLKANALDTFKFFAPKDPVFHLTKQTRYFWRVVITDAFGDSAVHGPDTLTTRADLPACDTGMALVEVKTLSFCMDRYEFTKGRYRLWETYMDSLWWSAIDTADSSRPNAADSLSLLPRRGDQGFFLDTTDIFPVTMMQAWVGDSMCKLEGKLLCTQDQWRAASGGYRQWAYPYGETYDSTKCRTTESRKPFSSFAGEVGSFDSCVTPTGIYDLSGNVNEWVRATPTQLQVGFDFTKGYKIFLDLGGAWFSRAESGTNTTDSTIFAYRPDIGFRCCKSLK